jgi:hypothetical protein
MLTNDAEIVALRRVRRRFVPRIGEDERRRVNERFARAVEVVRKWR